MLASSGRCLAIPQVFGGILWSPPRRTQKLKFYLRIIGGAHGKFSAAEFGEFCGLVLGIPAWDNRRWNSWRIHRLSHFLTLLVISSRLMLWNSWTNAFSPEELHTVSKTSHVSIKMGAVNFIKRIQVSPEELHMLLKMSHVSIKMTPVNLIGLGHPEPTNAKLT